MKTYLLLILCLLGSCIGNNENATETADYERKASVSRPVVDSAMCDTIRSIVLDEGGFADRSYEVSHIYSIDRDKEEICIKHNGSLEIIIDLPSSDIDVKNFAVDDLEKTIDGFKINISWGGGKDFFKTTFLFTHYDTSFYLKEVTKSIYHQDRDKKIITKDIISPEINVVDVIIEDYLK
jgi:hypothetical protein